MEDEHDYNGMSPRIRVQVTPTKHALPKRSLLQPVQFKYDDMQ